MRKELGSLALVHPYKCEWIKIRVKNKNTEIEGFILFFNIKRYLRKKYHFHICENGYKDEFISMSFMSIVSINVFNGKLWIESNIYMES